MKSSPEETEDKLRNQKEFASFESERRKNNPDFTFKTYMQESHRQIIYAVEFCNALNDGQLTIFATCGSNFLTIYECQNNGEISLLQCYQDPSPNELYYTLAWSNTAELRLAVAGFNQIIRIIHPWTMTSNMHLLGHGLAVNDLKFHPKNSNLLLSASKDDSVRLWNIKSGVCIAIFHGIDGHKCEVLSVDFDATGNRIVTSAVDHSVRIWRLNKPAMEEAIEASFNGLYGFKSLIEHFPEYSVDDIHKKYVDCVKWMGNLILSKSNENAIVCWKPGCLQQRPTSIKNDSTIGSVIHKFRYPGERYFCIRFSMDVRMTYLAVGNDRGTTFLWNINGNKPDKSMHLRHKFCNVTVRATAFSRDAKILITVCDDGTVWKWDRTDSVE